MQITSRISKLILLISLSNDVYAQTLDIASEGKIIKASNGARLEIDTENLLILTKSTIKIHGKQYIAIITQHPSSENPLGYCGAGNETYLKVYELYKMKFKLSDSMLLESCLKGILMTDNHKKIKDRNAVSISGKTITIHWEQRDQDVDFTESYSLENGKLSIIESSYQNQGQP
ncbi:MAG: hypothetical protein PGN19_01570 [Pseudomonas oryzihabitans]